MSAATEFETVISRSIQARQDGSDRRAQACETWLGSNDVDVSLSAARSCELSLIVSWGMTAVRKATIVGIGIDARSLCYDMLVAGFVNLWEDKIEGGCTLGAFHHFQVGTRFVHPVATAFDRVVRSFRASS